MKKTLEWGLSAAAVAAIIAAVVAVVLVLVLKKKETTPVKRLSERVMYFAIHLGDVEASFKTKDDKYKSQKCSLDVNVDSTRSSITAMRDVTQKYTFILFSDKIETTTPMNREEAIAKVASIKPETQESSFSQEAVVKEFERRSGEHDLLVYYIPCSFDYSHDDEDVKKFVEEVKKARLERRILAVSNVRPAKQVSVLYQLDNVAGSDTPFIARKISQFDNENYNAKILELNFVQDNDNYNAEIPELNFVQDNDNYNAEIPELNLVQDNDNYNAKISELNFVQDNDNYNAEIGEPNSLYERGMKFISELGYDLVQPWWYKATVGLWAYGYTNFSKSLNTTLEHMSDNYNVFHNDLLKMVYEEDAEPMTSKEAIEAINEMYVPGRRANCIVFFSAQRNTANLPKINPRNMKHVDRVVAVGIDTEPGHIIPKNGRFLKVPWYFPVSSGLRIFDLVMEG
ncbi:hypothetical protein Aduo_006819 [Ancylostoma duodenale]